MVICGLYSQSRFVFRAFYYYTKLNHRPKQVSIKEKYERDYQIIDFTIFAGSPYGYSGNTLQVIWQAIFPLRFHFGTSYSS
jgi:hypothetical protein